MTVRRSKRALKQHKMVLALDAACRARVMERDQRTCQRCGKADGDWDDTTQSYVSVQWSHVHSRRHHCLRWDDDNSKCLCQRCHMWWTNNPGLAYDFFIKKFPDRWERITRVLQANPKVRVPELFAELSNK